MAKKLIFTLLTVGAMLLLASCDETVVRYSCDCDCNYCDCGHDWQEKEHCYEPGEYEGWRD
jgi:hypothetical protein